ncbi:type II inositol 1,4,5-trisphosphate 5-phosphatase [Onthophagus taurus]|uniref:type II inositol 1,4,5-trisphosphate 5-phosphatase n=1 Tax=Onthophagus taurus TaxID=166361 RepID=UPI0039BDEECE
MSNDQEVINIIGEKLSSSNITIKNVLLSVVIPQEVLTLSNIIFTLVECNGSYGLFIFESGKRIPTKFSDLTIEHVIPIDEYFYCDNESIPSSYTHERFSITYKMLRLTFHIEIGPDSDVFKDEITRAKEAFLLNSVDHKWLERYRNDSGSYDVEFGEGNLPASRQRGARGHTSASRESMLRFEMESRKSQYTKITERSIFVGTWNVNGQLPPPNLMLKYWLAIEKEPPMLYAIGFQELDLSKEAFLFNDSPREAEWEKAVMASTHPDAKYRRLALIRLVGIQLIVLIHSDHYSHVKDVDSSTVGTGLLGKMGNKGGVAVRIRLYDTTLCFVCSHLAAHQDEVERRNQDYRDIVDRINFRKPPQTIKEHDQLYWLGDLNYRIMKFNGDDVKKLLYAKELDLLLKHDQLMLEQQKGKCFEGFLEAPIHFQPTYKYDLNSDHYDTSEKGRAPAWTDRVLYRGKGIHPTVYRCHMELQTSDHKPISCVFKSEIAVIDETKQKRVQEEVFKLMDKLENEILPQVTVDRTELTFERVRFNEPVHKEVIVANTGQVPVTFCFANKIKEEKYCKDWLRITPNRKDIEPGDKCDIRFEVTLLDAGNYLEDILVLHLENGKDIFISVSAQCERSCFTTSISVLCRCPVPILNMTAEQIYQAEREQIPLRYSIPRELWLLVDYLYRHGLRMRMFESTALHDDIIKIRDWLDHGSLNPIPVDNVTAVAECLLLFLSHTKDPIIPYHLTETASSQANNFLNCREILEKVPDLHRSVFLYIIMFLKEVLKYGGENGTDPKILATIFGDILLRSPKGKIERQQIQRGKMGFVHQFLINDISSMIVPSANK